VILEGPLYVDGEIDINNATLEGREHVISEGFVDMTQAGYGSDDIPVIISLYGDIDMVGPVVDAVAYAPQGKVRVQNCQVNGAVGGDEVTISNSTLVYSAELAGRQDLPGSELFPLTYQYD
jgi:hypothetical protein